MILHTDHPNVRRVELASTDGFWSTVKADVHRVYGHSSVAKVVAGFLRVRTLRPVLTMRACQAAGQLRGPLRLPALAAARAAHRVACQLAGVDLPWRTKVGPGFLIAHGWGVVISHRTVIGRNCTLMHGVTLGRRDRIGSDGDRQTAFPVVGDDVFVGPNAVVVGGVTVGDGARVAGGSVVVHDVPPRAIVGPPPAVVLRLDAPPDVVNRVNYAA
ncbi:MAG TPA: DapH/DapD/GlmU-related protein [Humisphaera sp.]